MSSSIASLSTFQRIHFISLGKIGDSKPTRDHASAVKEFVKHQETHCGSGTDVISIMCGPSPGAQSLATLYASELMIHVQTDALFSTSLLLGPDTGFDAEYVINRLDEENITGANSLVLMVEGDLHRELAHEFLKKYHRERLPQIFEYDGHREIVVGHDHLFALYT